jgi:hypothetical protein
MAKKGYPGLVLVPPSDRTILRRRLLRWGLFITALVWCASILTQWPPGSDDRANCQSGVGQESGNSSPEKCGQPQSATEAPSNQNEFSLTQVSQAEGLIEPQNPPASATPNPHGLATKDDYGQDVKPKTSGPTSRPPDPNEVPPANEKLASTPPASKPTHDPDLDARLAEQGDAFAQYRLGRHYARRDGPQTPESVTWYRKASSGLHRLAETGNGQAMYVLGVMYAYGRGVPRDTEQARRWLTRAVENKITAAQPVLAKLVVQPQTTPNPKAAGREKTLQQD